MLGQAMDDYINLPLLGKLLVIAILAPAWVPIIHALWREVNESLVEEGGVLGGTPTRGEAELLAQQRRESGESLVSVTIEAAKARRSVRPSAHAQVNTRRPGQGLRPTGKLRRTARRSF
jgi:hypothetical protein